MPSKKEKELKILLRMKKFDVDECRKTLAMLINQEDLLLKKKIAMMMEMENEKIVASKNPDAAFSFPAYYKLYLNRKKILDTEIYNMSQKIAAQRELLSEKFLDLKTFEITKNNLNNKEKYQENIKEQKILDEISANVFRLKNSEASFF